MALEDGDGEDVGDLGEPKGVERGDICRGVLTVEELFGEPFGVRSFMDEFGDKEGFIAGDVLIGLGNVDGDDLRGD